MLGSILITNDDGINSPGINYLIEELSKQGFDVYVVAPKNQVSGAGKSHSFYVKVEKCYVKNAKESWCVDGKPADAVAIGLRYLLKDVKPDIIVSGINIGPNMGLMDFFTSGTIGGALEGILLGYKAIAASFAVLRGIKTREQDILLKKAAKITAEISKIMLDIFREEKIDLININFPSIKPIGFKVTKMSWLSNMDVKLDSKDDVYQVMGWKTDNLEEAYAGGEEESDVAMVKKGYISLSPLCVRCIPEAISYVKAFNKIENRIKGIENLILA
ncbi:5''/3''-nucleotidase SurE [Caldisphaera lagunensis DSM 15908]|uniref:5'-nucleotidase SurE n=1 Tax=Caldisphaera lagunensis (strain DSM 15908 / JCM 11604 / ANMR 0165 / IC-154) TaxID=1056495 RepID=L0ACT8_CALLD|nr:5'/3'-nucleotidase SurE [Caldisphaera lagunensis]AFZ70870.1 5''/3''-nucleotidase SurE [Caldisphaera lagunensis DSM 15908]